MRFPKQNKENLIIIGVVGCPKMNQNKSKNKYNDVLAYDFLRKEYIKNQKSISQIAKEQRIYWDTVKRYIQSHKIKLRTHKEQATISSPGREYKYINFLTREFFIKNYLKSNMSITDLTTKFGIDKSVMLRYMKKLNIRRRTCHEQWKLSHPPKEFHLTEECLAFFDGLLSGDGSVPKRSNGKIKSYTQCCKYREYLKYIARRASAYGITFSPILTCWINDSRCKKGGYTQSFLQAHRFKTFDILRGKWYDKKGSKIIPKDFRFSPDSMLQLYLSDGNFYREIRLCVSGFDMPNVLFLQKLIERNLNIKTRLIQSRGPGNDIIIKKSDAEKFLTYIGKCPVKCYRYKWKDNVSKKQKLKQNQRARKVYHLKKLKNKAKIP